MRKSKISKIGIIKGFKSNLINFKNIKYFHNRNYKKNEQLDSLFVANRWFTDDLLISFSDIIYENSIFQNSIFLKFYFSEFYFLKILFFRILFPQNFIFQNSISSKFDFSEFYFLKILFFRILFFRIRGKIFGTREIPDQNSGF